MTAASFTLGDPLSLESENKSEGGRSPKYTLDVTKPVLKGSGDPRVDDFNQQVSKIIDEQVAEFKSGLDASFPQMSPNGSTLTIDYSLKSPPGTIISLMIRGDRYMDGAAHPGQSFETLNYDLAAGKTMSLSRLFLPGVPYLELLASVCQAELARRDTLQFPEGAAPTAGNYQNWVVTAQGIEITFNEYQVAPYAAGPQDVLVPYSQLYGKLELSGPLGKIVH